MWVSRREIRLSGMSRQRAARLALAVVAVLSIPPHPAGAQATEARPQRRRIRWPLPLSTAAATAVTGEQPARVVFANRVIVEFRATVLSRTPSQRAPRQRPI